MLAAGGVGMAVRRTRPSRVLAGTTEVVKSDGYLCSRPRRSMHARTRSWTQEARMQVHSTRRVLSLYTIRRDMRCLPHVRRYLVLSVR